MLQHLLHAMPVALCMVDESRHIYFRNQRFLEKEGLLYPMVELLQSLKLLRKKELFLVNLRKWINLFKT
jgi:hypothetical protein